jgi:hypothetical protein
MAGESNPNKKRPSWVRYRVLIYLVLGLVGLDVLVARHKSTWQAYDPDDFIERVNNCRRRAPDLVVVGGSPVTEGVDPAFLVGLRWNGRVISHPYNLGLPGATMLEVWHAVKHCLPRPPRLLIYGITATDINDERMDRHGPASLMDVGDLLHLGRTRPWKALWCLKYFAQARVARGWRLLYYRRGIQLWAAGHLESLWPGLCPELVAEAKRCQNYYAAMHRPDGFAPQPACQARRLDQLKAGGAPFYFHFLNNYRLGGHLAFVHHLLDWAAARNVPVVLVDMPVSEDLAERMHPHEFACYRTALERLERDRDVCVLRPDRAMLGLTDADFGDLVHMNASGTAKFSAWLRAALEEKDYSQVPQGAYLHPGPVK